MKIPVKIIGYYLKNGNYEYQILSEGGKTGVDKVRMYLEFDSSILELHNTLVIAPLEIDHIVSRVPKDNIIVFYGKKLNKSDVSLIENQKRPVIFVKSDKYYEILNCISDGFEKLNEWDKTLEMASNDTKNFQRIVDCGKNVLGAPVAIIDSEFSFVAYTSGESEKRGYVSIMVENGRVSFETSSQLMISPGFEKISTKKEVFTFEDEYEFFGKNIFYNDRYVGRIIAIREEDEARNDLLKFAIDVMGKYVAKMYERQGSFFIKKDISYRLNNLVKNSLEGKQVSASDWEHALAERGWKRGDGYYLMTFEANYRAEKKIHGDYLCPQIENKWTYTSATVVGDLAVILINCAKMDKKFEQTLGLFVRDNLLVAGISMVFTDFSKINDYLIQANLAIEIGVKAKPYLWYYFFTDYEVIYIKEQCTKEISAESLLHPALIALKEHDALNKTDYYESLKLFLECRYNMSAAAKEAFVHRTTFIKRMEKIVDITKIDLDDWDTRLHLMMSYSLNEE